MITQEELKKHVHYNPETGEFRWVIRKRGIDPKRTDIGCVHRRYGYLMIGINHKQRPAHRLAFLYMTGKFPKDDVDHINGDRLDNRWENLRTVTRKDNMKNKGRLEKNTSGVTGISWVKQSKAWRVYIAEDTRQIHLWYGRDFFEACCQRKSAELRYGFHENHGKREAFTLDAQ